MPYQDTPRSGFDPELSVGPWVTQCWQQWKFFGTQSIKGDGII